MIMEGSHGIPESQNVISGIYFAQTTSIPILYHDFCYKIIYMEQTNFVIFLIFVPMMNIDYLSF